MPQTLDCNRLCLPGSCSVYPGCRHQTQRHMLTRRPLRKAQLDLRLMSGGVAHVCQRRKCCLHFCAEQKSPPEIKIGVLTLRCSLLLKLRRPPIKPKPCNFCNVRSVNLGWHCQPRTDQDSHPAQLLVTRLERRPFPHWRGLVHVCVCVCAPPSFITTVWWRNCWQNH